MDINRVKEVLDVGEAAELLKVSREVVYDLLKSGSLPGRKVGREWRMSRVAILEWLAFVDNEAVERARYE